jgi:transmembrane 9 superfamily protein 3
MFIDDLPIWGSFKHREIFLIVFFFRILGIVGEMDETGKSAYIWTHKKFEIGYNNDRIVDVNLTSEAKVRLQPNMQLLFTYEVLWKPTNIPFAKRFDKYLDPGFFQHKVKKQN